jgi:predicted DCC family thiol-disulfide oxidoreductase YuxK
MKETEAKGIILFDGVCNFCDATVNFLLKLDTEEKFLFASLQSNTGQNLLTKLSMSTEYFDSFVYVKGDKFFTKSTAALQIAKDLRKWWQLLYILVFIPAPIRDRCYDWIAKNRYKWFGKKQECAIPTPEMRKRFLK